MDSPLSHSPADPPLPLAVCLLGRFAVSVGSVELAAERWPSLRAAHLVQLLALQPRRRMTREQVIDALWSLLDPEAGAANLRKATHHARQALGRHDAIVVQGGEVVLWPERSVTVDAEEFERRAEAALARRDAAECAEVARSYAGDLLPGARYEAWTELARERLHATHVNLLRTAAQWEKLAQLEPTDEPAHRALMQRELESGNRAAALRWYAHLREALQQSLGVLPDRQTEALYERCLAGLRTSGPAFVGRALPLAQVAAWLGTAGEERPGAIVLRGPAGIGKSALCREIAAQARSRDWAVVRVDAVRSGRPYAVVSALVERLLLADRGLLDRIGPSARNVLALHSPLAAPAEALPGPLGRHQVVGAVRRLLVASAAGADVLLQVDDAHLADDADVDVLLQLAVAGSPVCLLLSARAPAAGSALARGIARLQRLG
ncbi:MAG TPA: AAA family ATPase, partial [Albitalea sp.]